MKNRNRSERFPRTKASQRSRGIAPSPTFRCIFELTLPCPSVSNDPETRNAFLYAVGLHAESHRVTFHAFSARDGLDLCLCVKRRSDAEAFVRALAADLEGYLAERFEWPLEKVHARAMMQPLHGALPVMDALAFIGVRDRLGAAMMMPEMLSGAAGFVEVPHLKHAA